MLMLMLAPHEESHHNLLEHQAEPLPQEVPQRLLLVGTLRQFHISRGVGTLEGRMV
jgi:hypothetical protein